jgi:ketosteroid isomerase-like protein
MPGGVKLRATDARALHEISERWVQYFLQGDLERLLALYHPDAVIMSSGQARVAGADAVRKLLGGLVQAKGKATRICIEDLGADRRTAWASVLAAINFEIPGAPPREYFSRTFLVYRKNAAGQWLIFRDLDMPTPDAEPLRTVGQ